MLNAMGIAKTRPTISLKTQSSQQDLTCKNKINAKLAWEAEINSHKQKHLG